MNANACTPKTDPKPARTRRGRWLLPTLLALAALLAVLVMAARFCWRAGKAKERIPVELIGLADGKADYALALLAHLPRVTETSDHLPADPINLLFYGTEKDLIRAFTKARWSRADTGFWAGWREVYSVALYLSDPQAPISALVYQGRAQDIAFEMQIGDSPVKRDHVRFRMVSEHGPDGRPVWVGSATRDVGWGPDWCHFPWPTHRIDPDVNHERDLLMDALKAAHQFIETRQVKAWPAWTATNGGGDAYHSDGAVGLGVLVAGQDA